jgi:hypothetical protein
MVAYKLVCILDCSALHFCKTLKTSSKRDGAAKNIQNAKLQRTPVGTHSVLGVRISPLQSVSVLIFKLTIALVHLWFMRVG